MPVPPWYAYRNGNWLTLSSNAASPWYDSSTQTAANRIPQSGDAVHINGFTVVWDDAVTTTTFNTLDFGAGQVQVSVANIAKTLNVTGASTGGTNAGGSIQVTAAGHTLSLNFTGGFTAGSGPGIVNHNAATVVTTGNITGGTAAGAYGYDGGSTSSGSCTIAGTVKGGTNATAYGAYDNTSNQGPAITVTGSLDYTGTAIPVQVQAGNMLWWNPTPGSNSRILLNGPGNFPNVLTGYCGDTDPGAANVLNTAANYWVNGVMHTPTATVPAVAKVYSGTHYGVGGNGSTGTLHASNLHSGAGRRAWTWRRPRCNRA